MTTAQISAPFRAYQGDDPYVFICFAHEDSAKVYPDIKWLNDSGVNIWYDEGVSPGHLWRDDIANAIDRCSLFVFFLSTAGVESINCRKEVNYALESGKPFLVIYLEEVKLPPGIALAIGEIQGILRYTLSELEYRNKVLEFLEENLEKEFEDSGAPLVGLRKFRWSIRHSLLIAVLTLLGGVLVYENFDFPGNRQSPTTLSFTPRDWILLVFENNTNNALFDGSLETALRVSLNESTYLNLFSPSRIRHSLRRMDRSGTMPLNPSLGNEIALREGISAVVDASIEEKDDAYLLNARIIDPQTRLTVYSHSEIAEAGDEVLSKLSVLANMVRSALGEPQEMIREREVSLPQVTTSSLDALRLYANAVENAYSVPMDETIEQLEQALTLDPNFALAHAKLATFIIAVDGDTSFALSHYEAAMANSDRLSQRERLYVEASRAWLESPEEMERKWRLLASVYPDEVAAHHNLGSVRWRYFNDFSGAIPHFREALRIYPDHGGIHHNLGYAHLALGETDKALGAFKKARDLNGFVEGLADAYIVLGDFAKAREVLRSSERPTINEQIPKITRLVSVALGEGDTRTAYDLADEGSRLAKQTGTYRSHIGFSGAVLAISTRFDAAQFERELNATVELVLDIAEQQRLARVPTRELALIGKLAARHGHLPTAKRLAKYISKNDDHAGHPLSRDYASMLTADIALADGDTETARTLLESIITSSNLFQAHEGLARAASLNGDKHRELSELQWIADHPGQALAQYSDTMMGREMNLLHWQEARARLQGIHVASRSWFSVAVPQPTTAMAPSSR